MMMKMTDIRMLQFPTHSPWLQSLLALSFCAGQSDFSVTLKNKQGKRLKSLLKEIVQLRNFVNVMLSSLAVVAIVGT